MNKKFELKSSLYAIFNQLPDISTKTCIRVLCALIYYGIYKGKILPQMLQNSFFCLSNGNGFSSER